MLLRRNDRVHFRYAAVRIGGGRGVTLEVAESLHHLA